MATGESFNYLPAGPILGLPLAMQAQEQHSNADRRIRGKKNSYSLIWRINPVWHGTGHFYPFVFVRSDFVS